MGLKNMLNYSNTLSVDLKGYENDLKASVFFTKLMMMINELKG